MDVARGQALAVAGVALFLVSMGASVALAPSIGVAGGGDAETLVGVQGGGPGWHDYGRVTMYEGRDVAWQLTGTDSYFDVQRADDGTVLAGFMDGGREDCGPYGAPCAHTGFQRIDPDADGGPAVVDEYGFPVRSMKNSEVHDVEPLGGGEYLLTDMDRERLVVVDGGEVVWQWNASELYEPPEDPTRTDWLHINDVDVIEEGRFLVSVRNANQLVIVERGEGAVEVVNEDDGGDDATCQGQLVDADGDGDVRCGDPAVLNHQHNPQWLGDGAVLVADSDNDRIVELHRTDDGDWEPAWVLESAGGVDLQWPRDADRLPNGNTLVTDTHNRRVFEVNESGEVVWSVRTEYVPYEADRLPGNERAGDLPRYEGDAVTGPASGVPLLSTALVGLRAAWSGLPFWFREWQLLATLLSLGLVVAGAIDYRRGG
ncbi:MAG: arylsulfotransferase family protein [Halobacteriales archaeon]